MRTRSGWRRSGSQQASSRSSGLDSHPWHLALVVAAALAAAVRRLRSASRLLPRRGRERSLLAAFALTVLATLFGLASASFAFRPLLEWDGWAIWALKAKALYFTGGTAGPVFESTAYHASHLDYPLFLPALEAFAFRALDSADERLVHLQLLGIAVAYIGALWGLLADRVRTDVLALTLLALASAPAVLSQLVSNYADLPLAFFVSLGLVSAVVWIEEGEAFPQIAYATVFFAAAAMTKNEGLLFVGCAYAALLAGTWTARRSLIPVIASLAATGLLLLPWRIYVAMHDTEGGEFDFARLTHPSELGATAERLPPTLTRLLGELIALRWGLIVPLAAIALSATVLAGRRPVALFAVMWSALTFVGLAAIYWISLLPIEVHLRNSASRTVSTLVVGLGSIAPLLLVPAAHRRPEDSREARLTSVARVAGRRFR